MRKKNVLNIPLVKTDDIILPLLHLKLGYMKQFVKRLDKNSQAFLQLKLVLPKLSETKIKEGTYNLPPLHSSKKNIYTYFNTLIKL